MVFPNLDLSNLNLSGMGPLFSDDFLSLHANDRPVLPDPGGADALTSARSNATNGSRNGKTAEASPLDAFDALANNPSTLLAGSRRASSTPSLAPTPLVKPDNAPVFGESNQLLQSATRRSEEIQANLKRLQGDISRLSENHSLDELMDLDFDYAPVDDLLNNLSAPTNSANPPTSDDDPSNLLSMFSDDSSEEATADAQP
jgi:hypothetical protein